MRRLAVVGACLTLVVTACSGASGGGTGSASETTGRTGATAVVPTHAQADTSPCPHSPGPRISAFPDATLDCLTGPGSVNIARLHGRPELINIWASWCGPCRNETARLQRAYEQVGDSVVFLGVDVKDSAPHALTFLASQHVTYPQVSDPEAAFPRQIRLAGVPNTLVVDRTGHIIYRRIGELSEAQLRRALARLGAPLGR